MKKRMLRIAYLFPDEMSTYGDRGNIITLVQRLQWRGFGAEVVEYRPGDAQPHNIDMFFIGGGQDSGQRVIGSSILRLKPWLSEAIESGMPGLVICGGLQLLGQYFEMVSGDRVEGLGIFALHTIGGAERLTGNVHVQSDTFGEVLGFENHSGRTYLDKPHQAMGRVVLGAGNNNEDGTEGILHRHTMGTYLHGPVLPKNPVIADWLIAGALGISSTELAQLPDQFLAHARAFSRRRPR